MYKFLIRPVLFLFDPEVVHHITFMLLRFIGRVPGAKWILGKAFTLEGESLRKTLFGLSFPNRIGLAAGFDKDAKLIDELGCFGFGFIEIGTITPRPQPGNDKPRLFRLPKDSALINRMGFNNRGAKQAAEQLSKRKSKIIVGGNIGKNKTTPNEHALADYTACIDTLYPYVDYFVINVSSPNTPDLRALQNKDPLQKLLMEIRNYVKTKPVVKPVLLKIAPDLTSEQLNDIVDVLLITKIDGVIATNTTVGREGLRSANAKLDQIGSGGLSGMPLCNRSTEVIKFLRGKLGPDFPIIGVGGIMSVEDALDKIKAGADLIQIYTGFVYNGPYFVKKINKGILRILAV